MLNRSLTFFLLVLLSSVHAQILPPPAGLTVEYLRAPEYAVITDSEPELGWIFPEEGKEQSHYRILVASSPFLLQERAADLWDSDKVADRNSQNISYGGNQLLPESTYWWQVKIWTESGEESVYSAPQQFNISESGANARDYSVKSNWVELGTDNWVSRDMQRAGFQNIYPEIFLQNSGGNYFADFGKSAFGILEFSASAKRDGVPLVIHFGERSTSSSEVHKVTGHSNITYEIAELQLKKGLHNYRVVFPERPPSHYLHSQDLAAHFPEVIPFRYIEIEGDNREYILNDVRQSALFYYFDDTASQFHSSNEKLNRVWELCKYTLKATPFLGVYADGNRERMPYEADAYIQQLGHYAVDREYSISRHTIGFLLNHASWPTEWQMHVVMMAWEYYMQTGDAEFLSDHYDDIRRKVLISLTERNGLISTRTGKVTREFLDSLNFPGPVTQFSDIVDWPQGPKDGTAPGVYQSPVKGGETDEFVYTDYNSVVNAFHYRALVLMSKIAGVVGNDDDRAYLVTRSEEHRAAFYKAFFDNDRGVFKDGITTDHASLHANMFPLAFGMVSDDNVPGVADFIRSRGMACSVYGSQYLLEALFAAGAGEYALALMTSEEKRSWMNMIRVGSSMTTEAWDEYYKPNLTWNHAWGAAPVNIVARKLFGIEPLEPGYARFRIAPQPASLEVAALTVPTLSGSIFCSISNKSDQWELEFAVPGNCEAEVFIPSVFKTVFLNGSECAPVREEVHNLTVHRVFVTGSGKHRLIAR